MKAYVLMNIEGKEHMFAQFWAHNYMYKTKGNTTQALYLVIL